MRCDRLRARMAGLALFLALALAAFPLAAAANQFGAWTVSCSSRTYCVAAADAHGADGARAVFKLERGPAAHSKVFVTTGPSEPLALGMRVDVDIYGLDEPYGVFGEVQRIYDGNEMTFAGPARRKFVAMLRAGASADISVAFGGSTGTLTYRVSLAGLTLALLEIDRRQGRLDRTDAIVAWGGLAPPQDLPQAPEPAPPAAAAAAGEPAITVAASGPPAVAAYDLVYTTADLPPDVAGAGADLLGCALDEAVPMFGAQVIAFSTGAALHIVPCHPADANVDAYITWRSSPGAPDNLIEFGRPDGEETTALMTNPEYDRVSGAITSHGYYSAEYDCGHFSAWAFDPDRARVRLLEERVKEDCDGAVLPPTTWPLVR